MRFALAPLFVALIFPFAATTKKTLKAKIPGQPVEISLEIPGFAAKDDPGNPDRTIAFGATGEDPPDARSTLIFGAIGWYDSNGTHAGRAYIFGGNDLFLQANQMSYAAGDTLTLANRGGEPGVFSMIVPTGTASR